MTDATSQGGLDDLRRTLPSGVSIRMTETPEQLHIRSLSCQTTRSGHGTTALRLCLAYCDRKKLDCILFADATLDPDDPSLADLIRWYGRHGFKAVGATADLWVFMQRKANDHSPSMPICEAHFSNWLESLPLINAEDYDA